MGRRPRAAAAAAVLVLLAVPGCGEAGPPLGPAGVSAPAASGGGTAAGTQDPASGEPGGSSGRGGSGGSSGSGRSAAPSGSSGATGSARQEGTAGPRSGSSSGSSSGSGRSPAGSGSSSATADPRDEGFAWVPWGPADPSDPPPVQWYGSLERRDCANLHGAVGEEPGRELWRALAAVCSAVVEGDEDQWAVAEAQAALATGAGAGGVGAGCLEAPARALLQRALTWHRANPDGRPVVSFPAPGSRTACPFEITRVQLLGEDGSPLDGPLEGPVAGGTLLVVRGEGLDDPTEVRIGGRPAQLDPGVFPPDGVAVRTPPAGRPGAVDVRLTNRAGEVTAPQRFTYAADPEPQPQPQPRPEPETQPGPEPGPQRQPEPEPAPAPEADAGAPTGTATETATTAPATGG